MNKLIALYITLALLLSTVMIARATRQDWIAIPSVNISERLQYADLNTNTQTVCDKRDRAVAYDYRGSISIADHNHQGFKNLHKVKVGDTATVILHGKVTQYRCIRKFNGVNKKAYLTDNNGNIAEITKNQVIMYTCIKGYTRKIIITKWQKVR